MSWSSRWLCLWESLMDLLRLCASDLVFAFARGPRDITGLWFTFYFNFSAWWFVKNEGKVVFKIWHNKPQAHVSDSQGGTFYLFSNTRGTHRHPSRALCGWMALSLSPRPLGLQPFVSLTQTPPTRCGPLSFPARLLTAVVVHTSPWHSCLYICDWIQCHSAM